MGSVKVGVSEMLPPGVLTPNRGIVPSGLEPLQSNSADPDEPAATEESGWLFGVNAVRVVQLTVIPDTAGIAGKVCVKRLVAA